MKNFKRILVFLIMVLVSAVGITACGSPYKNMKLTIDNGGFENALIRRYDYDAYEKSFNISATVSGVKSGVNKDVVFESQDKNVVDIEGEPTKEDGTTTQTFKIKDVGSTYITVTTAEGNLSENIEITIFSNPTSINFINSSVPIIKGDSVDLTRVSSNYVVAPIKFEPAHTTEKNVTYDVYDSSACTNLIPEDAGVYSVNGNAFAISESTDKTDLYIVAKTENGKMSEPTHIKVLEKINMDTMGLSYTFTKNDSANSNNVATLYDVERSSENGIDYQIYLADQFAGDELKDSKNVYLTKKVLSGNNKYKTDLVTDYSMTLLNNNQADHLYIFSSQLGNSTKRNCYSICNGEGEGNSDIVRFNINYAGYESFFKGIDITLKITIDAFPNKIVITQDVNIEQLTEVDSFLVFNNYVEKLGTPFCVKILNKGNEFISSQFVYVGVKLIDEGGEEIVDADRAYFTIYDAYQNVITPNTAVKSGEQLFIRYNSTYFYDSDGNRIESKPDGDFVLYAVSCIDNTIDSVERDGDGKIVFDYDFDTDKYSHSHNNLLLAQLNYAVASEDITIKTNKNEEPEAFKTKLDLRTLEDTDDVYPDIRLFDVAVGDTSLIELKLVPSGNHFKYEVWPKKFNDRYVLGATYITIVAPNGTTERIDVFVTVNAGASKFQLKIGNLILNDDDEYKINMNVSSRQFISVLIDDVEYDSQNLPNFEMTVTPSLGKSSSASVDVIISNNIAHMTDEFDEYNFLINGEDEKGDPFNAANFKLAIRVIKPVNDISRNKASVEFLYNAINKITDATIDGAVDKKYTDMSDKSEFQFEFTFNPSGSTIDINKLSTQFKYSESENWVENLFASSSMGQDSWTFTEVAVPASADEPGASEPALIKKGHFLFMRELLGSSLEYVSVEFDVEQYIIETQSKIIVKINNVKSNKTEYMYEPVEFSLRVKYLQDYNMSTVKQYYLATNSSGELTGDVYSNYEANGKDGTDVIVQYKNKVSYIAGQKPSISNLIDSDTAIEGYEYFEIDGIRFAITKELKTYTDADGDFPFYIYKFEYDKYKVDMFSTVSMRLTYPDITKTISLKGIGKEDNVKSYTIGSTRWSASIVDNEGAVISGSTIFYEISIEGNKYLIIKGDKDKKVYDFALQGTPGNWKTKEVQLTGGLVVKEITDSHVVVFTGEKTYSKSLNKNALETMNKKRYYIGNDGEYFLYTEENDRYGSRVSHVGPYAVKDLQFNTDGPVVLSVNIAGINYTAKEDGKYIEFSSFGFYYSITPNNPYLKGVLLRYPTSSNTYKTTQLIYSNGNVIGSSAEIKYQNFMNQVISAGLIISCDYRTSHIEFLIINRSAFENYMSSLGYDAEFTLGTIDTNSNNGENFGVQTEFKLHLNTGSYNNPYKVGNAKEFNEIRYDLSAYYEIIQNISLAQFIKENGWTPIGDLNETFKGYIYSSTGHTISDFYLTYNYGTDMYGMFYDTANKKISGAIGLFGNVESGSDLYKATFENITFENFRVDFNVEQQIELNNSNYSSAHVLIGSVAGSFNGTLKNVNFVSDNGAIYNSSSINHSSRDNGVYIKHSDVINAQTNENNFYYYVGGMFGSVGSISGSYLDDLSVKSKVYVSANKENIIAYVGGMAGYINSTSAIKNISTNSLVMSDVEFYSDTAPSATGGVIGYAGFDITINNLNSTNYVEGIDNVGGLLGNVGTKLQLKSAMIVPYVIGVENIGGLIGQANNVSIDSVKVQFIDNSSALNSIFNSSIVGVNNIGGIAGRITSEANIEYASVMSYVQKDISFVDDIMLNNESRYLGDIVSYGDESNIGGFVGSANILQSLQIENGYYNAIATIYGNDSEVEDVAMGGTRITERYFGGLIGHIAKNTASNPLVITNSAVDGATYYKNDTTYVGGFVGFASIGLNNLTWETVDDPSGAYQRLKSGYGAVDPYNIINSYTVLKSAEFNDSLVYIENFVGRNEYAENVVELLRITIAVDKNESSNFIIKISYDTPNTNYNEGIYELFESEQSEGTKIPVSFSGLPGEGVWSSQIAGDDITWNEESKTSSIKFSLIDGLDATYSYYIKGSLLPNILTKNSFHHNFITKVNIFSAIESALGVMTNEQLISHTFDADAKARQEWVGLGTYGLYDYEFNYYTNAGRLINDTETQNVNTYYDNVVMRVYGEVDETSGEYSVEMTTTSPDLTGLGSTEMEDKFYFNTLKNNYTTASNLKIISSEELLNWKKGTYVVTEGTKLSEEDKNSVIYKETSEGSGVYEQVYKLYFNNTKDESENFNILNGYPIPFAKYENLSEEELNSDIPKLVVDIMPTSLEVEVKEANRPQVDLNKSLLISYFSLTEDEQSIYNELSIKDESNLSVEQQDTLQLLKNKINNYKIKNTINVSTLLNMVIVPELASGDVIYSTQDTHIIRVSGQNIVIIGEGVATLKVQSKLNANLTQEINVVVIGFDYANIVWTLESSNGNLTSDKVEIVANDGTTLTSNIGYEGDVTFGIRYSFNVADVEAVGDVYDFLNSFVIAGHPMNDIAAGKVSINIDGLSHSVFCRILGSVDIEQTLYFKYTIDGVTHYKYFDNYKKTITYNFIEGLFGIGGSDDFEFVAINKDSFSVVLDSDSNIYNLSMDARLNNGTIFQINESELFEGANIHFTAQLYSGKLGYLTLSVDKIVFDVVKKLKTYSFSVYIDDAYQPSVEENLNYELRFYVEGTEFEHFINIKVMPQEVERVFINHYSNILFTVNPEPAVNQGNYKYPSEVIIPGYPSLLQIDMFPSFGRFDYVTVEANVKGINLMQVVEVIGNSELSNQYSWFESHDANTVITDSHIVIKDKYSGFNYDPYSYGYYYNGSIYVSVTTDESLADKNIIFTVKGYSLNSDGVKFEQSLELRVEARPQVEITSQVDEIKFGDVFSLGIKLSHVEESFSVSLKAEGENSEYIDVLGSVTYDASRGSYVFIVKDTQFTYITFHKYMYKRFNLTISVSKTINNIVVTDTATKDFILVPFTVSSINLNLAGKNKTNHQIIVDYYQLYDVVVSINAEYSSNYAVWLDSTGKTSINDQIKALNDNVALQMANYNILRQGTNTNKVSLLSNTNHTYWGEFNLNYNNTNALTTIRFISTTVTGFIWAEVGFNYNIFGVECTLAESADYVFNDYIDIIVDTASDDDRPEPITSVYDFLNMKEGISYILMKDLYLVNWTPINAVFSTFDGNGHVITMVSFADVGGIEKSSSGKYNIGIFSEIPETSIVKNVTIEVNPSKVAFNVVESDYENGTYDDIVNTAFNADTTNKNAVNNGGTTEYATKLEVNVSELKDGVNFGLLAGQNSGTITNIAITNNATSLRTERDYLINSIDKASGILDTNGDNYSTTINNFKDCDAVDSVKVTYNVTNASLQTSRGNNISLLVGDNSGYITNSNSENVSIEGEDYIAGLVSRNSGKITSSYFKGGNVIGELEAKANSGCGGLVAINTGEISYSYVLGRKAGQSDIVSNKGIQLSDYYTEGLHQYSYSGIITGNYAGGFAYQNDGKINNSYARILVAGDVSAGFVYKNESPNNGTNEGSVVEFCYALCSIKESSSGSYPFTNKYVFGNNTQLSGGTVIDCFYNKNQAFNMTDDAATGISTKDFKSYASFAGYAFNVDYSMNREILDGQWFIFSEYANRELFAHYFKNSLDTFEGDAPQIVTANQKILSIRYLVAADELNAAYNYSYIKLSGNTSIDRGSANNPILISSAENFNKQILSSGGVENRYFRFIKDITFTEADEVATTYNATFSGKLDGNNMKINNLRISADALDVESGELSRLGLFAKIEGYSDYVSYGLYNDAGEIQTYNINGETLGTPNDKKLKNGFELDAILDTITVGDDNYTKVKYDNDGSAIYQFIKSTDIVSYEVFYRDSSFETTYAVVKGLNIDIRQIDGANVNMVGVLAGEINNGKIYNVSISGEDFVVRGLNAVGSIAGRIKGETDIVNVSSNVSVKSTYFKHLNTFNSNDGDIAKVNQFELYYSIDGTNNLTHVGYAGGIVGICENNKFAIGVGAGDPQLQTLIDKDRINMFRLRRLYTQGSVTISGEVVGGIFGYLSNESNMSDCEIIVQDSMRIQASRMAGGLIGHNDGGEIKRCFVENYNQKEIDEELNKDISKYDNTTQEFKIGVQNLFIGNPMFIGGLVGFNNAGKIRYSYNRVNVANMESLYAGGIIGINYGGEYDNVYTTASVMAYSAIGGFTGLLSNAIGSGVGAGRFIINSIEDEEFAYHSLAGNSGTNYKEVLIANMWQYEHLNPYRNTIENPNATNAKIGAFIGALDDGGGEYTIGDYAPTSGSLYEEDNAVGYHVNVGTFVERAKADNIIIKTTYTYRTMGEQSKQLLKEIGGLERTSLFGIAYNDLAGKLGGEARANWAEELYRISDDKTGTDANEYHSYAEYLLDLVEEQTTKEIPYESEYLNKNENGRKAMIVNRFSSTVLFGIVNMDNKYFLSGKFRDSITSQQYYSYSRMSTYGSFRSLEEIFDRHYELSYANEFYSSLGSNNQEYASELNVPLMKSENNEVTGVEEITYVEIKITKGFNNIYEDWESEAWKGISLDADGKRTEQEYLFPYLQSSKDLDTSFYIYNADDLRELEENPGATYILMNDIYLPSQTMYCKSVAFTGTFRSAKAGDVDGNNEVMTNETFTIFNVELTNLSLANVGLFGAANGATFENFNVHISEINITGNDSESVGGLVGRAISCNFQNITVFGGDVPLPTTIEKSDWVNNLETVSIEGGEQIKIVKHVDIDDIINENEAMARISAVNTTFVGGIAGYAANCNIYYNDIERCVKDGSQYKLVKATDKMRVANVKIVARAFGTKNALDTTPNMAYYVGGMFGQFSVGDKFEYNSERENAEFVPFIVHNVNIETTHYSDSTKTTNDKFLSPEVSPNGIYIGGLAGFFNNPNMGEIKKIRKVVLTDIIIKSNVGAKGEVYCEKIELGGMFGRSEGAIIDAIEFGSTSGDLYITYKNGFDTSMVSSIYSSGKSGSATPVQHMIGGLIGCMNNSTIQNTYFNRPIKVTIDSVNRVDTPFGNLDVGGLVGVLQGESVLYGIANSNEKLIELKIKDNGKTSTITNPNFGGVVGRVQNGISAESAEALEFEGINDGDALVNIAVFVDIEIDYQDDFVATLQVGGLVGELLAGVSKCAVNGEISMATKYSKSAQTQIVGGVVGVNYGSINQTINNANIEIGYMMNNPPIMVGSVYVGGIAGRVGSNAASKGGTISDCYNTGGINVKQGELIPPIFSTIRAQSQYVGGIAGTVETNASNLQRCYSVGFINLTGDKYTIEWLLRYNNIKTGTDAYGNDIWFYSGGFGGVVGKNINKATISNCYYNGDHVLLTNSYGTRIATKSMLFTSDNAMTGYNNKDGENDVWLKGAGAEYPRLAWVETYQNGNTNIQNVFKALQVEGTKVNPLHQIGTLTIAGTLRDKAIIFTTDSTIDIDDDATMDEKIVNSVVYGKNSVIVDFNFILGEVDKWSIINGITDTFAEKSTINKNYGYIVNCKFEKDGNIAHVIDNKGSIIASEFVVDYSSGRYSNNVVSGDGLLVYDKFTIGGTKHTNGRVLGVYDNCAQQCEITFINGITALDINAKHYSDVIIYETETGANKFHFVGAKYTTLGGSYNINVTEDSRTFSSYNVDGNEIDISEAYATGLKYSTYTMESSYKLTNETQGAFDFNRIWTWFDTTQAPQLQVFKKTHFHDKEMKSEYYWKQDSDEAGSSDCSTVSEGVVDVYTARGFAYAVSYLAQPIINIKDSIDLTGKIWNCASSFRGTINGNGFTIKNVIITDPNSPSMFGSLSNATITDVVIDNVTIVMGIGAWKYGGAIANHMTNSTIEKTGVTGVNIYRQTNSTNGVVSNSANGLMIGVNNSGVTDGSKENKIINSYTSFKVNKYNYDNSYNISAFIHTHNWSGETVDSLHLENIYSYSYLIGTNSLAGLSGNIYGGVDYAHGQDVIKNTLKGDRVIIVPFVSENYQGRNAESGFTQFDFILTWKSVTDGVSKEHNFGFPVIGGNIAFWWDCDKLINEDTGRIEIDSETNQPIYNGIWNDSSNIPTYNAAEKCFEVSTEEQLVWYLKVSERWRGTLSETTKAMNEDGENIAHYEVDDSQFRDDSDKRILGLKIMADLDLDGRVWSPISSEDNQFVGNIYGNGHTISNMSVLGKYYGQRDNGKEVYTEGYAGFMEEIYYGSVSNLHFVNPKLMADNHAGVLAASSYQSTITDVTVNGGYIAISGYDSSQTYSKYIGGIVGSASFSTIFNTKVEDTIIITKIGGENLTDSGITMGGIVGSAHETTIASCLVKDSQLKLNRTYATEYTYQYGVGGIVGYVTVRNSISFIKSCKVENISTYDLSSATNNRTGGIVGCAQFIEGNLSVSECSVYLDNPEDFHGHGFIVGAYYAETVKTGAGKGTLASSVNYPEKLNNLYVRLGKNDTRRAFIAPYTHEGITGTDIENRALYAINNAVLIDEGAIDVTTAYHTVTSDGDTKTNTMMTGHLPHTSAYKEADGIYEPNLYPSDSKIMFFYDYTYEWQGNPSEEIKTVSDEPIRLQSHNNLYYNWSSIGEYLMGEAYNSEANAGSTNRKLSNVIDAKASGKFDDIRSLITFRAGISLGFNLNLNANVTISKPLSSQYYPFGEYMPKVANTVTMSSDKIIDLNFTSADYDCVGLFGYTRNVSMTGIRLGGSNAVVKSTGSYVGALVGKTENNANLNITFSNIVLNNNFEIEGNDNVGGFVGFARNLTIRGVEDGETPTDENTCDLVVKGTHDRNDIYSDITSVNPSCAGGLIGAGFGEIKIYNIIATPSISTGNAIGGLIGYYSDRINSSVYRNGHLEIKNSQVGSSASIGSQSDSVSVGGAIGFGYGGPDGGGDPNVNVIENVTNAGVASICGSKFVGGIAGDFVGGIYNCTNSVTINGSASTTSHGTNSGGIVGKCTGVIYECTNSGIVKGSGYLGGIAGQLYEDASYTVDGDKFYNQFKGYNFGSIYGCSNSGEIVRVSYSTAPVNSDLQAKGGIVGYTYGSVNIVSNTNSKFMKSDGNVIGGIIGYAVQMSSPSATVSLNTVTASYIGDSMSYGTVGGIAGRVKGNVTINRYNKLMAASDKPVHLIGSSKVGACVGAAEVYYVSGTPSLGGGGILIMSLRRPVLPDINIKDDTTYTPSLALNGGSKALVIAMNYSGTLYGYKYGEISTSNVGDGIKAFGFANVSHKGGKYFELDRYEPVNEGFTNSKTVEFTHSSENYKASQTFTYSANLIFNGSGGVTLEEGDAGHDYASTAFSIVENFDTHENNFRFSYDISGMQSTADNWSSEFGQHLVGAVGTGTEYKARAKRIFHGITLSCNVYYDNIQLNYSGYFTATAQSSYRTKFIGIGFSSWSGWDASGAGSWTAANEPVTYNKNFDWN